MLSDSGGVATYHGVSCIYIYMYIYIHTIIDKSLGCTCVLAA
jgi:hypothetical protein